MPKSKVHAGGYTFCGVYLQFSDFLKVSFVVLNASVFKTYVSTEQVKCLMISSIIFLFSVGVVVKFNLTLAMVF